MKFIIVVWWMVGNGPLHGWESVEVAMPSVAKACALYRDLVRLRGEPFAHTVMVLEAPNYVSRGLTGVTCER